MRINGSELRRQVELLGVKKASGMLTEGLNSDQLVPEDFSIADLFEHLVPDGREVIRLMRDGQSLFENEAVSTGNFNVIMSNLVLAKVMEAYQQEEFVFSNIVPTLPARFRDGEIIASATGIGDAAQIVKEGDLYPYVGLTDDWLRTPAPKKRGFIVPVTKETILYDQTGTVYQRASAVGEWMGVSKENRLIDAFIDENTTAHRYRRRDRAAIASYGDNAGDHDFDNLAGSNTLADWTDIDTAEQLGDAMIDPMTGEPIVVDFSDLVVARQLKATAERIVNATEIRYTVSGAETQTLAPNPVRGKYRVITSRRIGARLATDTHWFLGNIAKTIAYMQSDPIQVLQAPVNSEAEFERDIVSRFKVSEMGAAVVMNPRYTVKST